MLSSTTSDHTPLSLASSSSSASPPPLPWTPTVPRRTSKRTPTATTMRTRTTPTATTTPTEFPTHPDDTPWFARPPLPTSMESSAIQDLASQSEDTSVAGPIETGKGGYAIGQSITITSKGKDVIGTPFLPKDPRTWSREDVRLWIVHISRRHNLPQVHPERFLMNGRALCLMSLNMFVYRVPCGGKQLFKDFQIRLSEAVWEQRGSLLTVDGKNYGSGRNREPLGNRW